MNLVHRWLCHSAYWRNAVETYIFPWVLDGLDIGANVLEVGPGPDVTTDLLRGRVERLTRKIRSLATRSEGGEEFLAFEYTYIR